MKTMLHSKKARIARFLALALVLAISVSAFAACKNDDLPTTEPIDTTAPEDTAPDLNESKYAEAYALLEKGEYEASYALFTELGDYKDAALEAGKFRYVFDGYTEPYGTPGDMGTETSVITYNEYNLPIKNVKSYHDGYVHTCTYEYDENGNMSHSECIINGEVYQKTELTHDENGNVLTLLTTYEDGVYSEERTYDENGNNITLKATGVGEYYDATYGGNYVASYDIFYDENGNCTHYVAVDGGEAIEGQYQYTEDGVLTKTLTTIAEAEGTKLEEELYDENGNLIKKTVSSEDGAVIISISEYTYDENGNVLTDNFKYYDEDGEYVSTYKYTYDEKGNCIKRETEDSNRYTSVRTIDYRLVYIPYEYSENTWTAIIDNLFNN